MNNSVFSSTMTLDGAPYLAASAKVAQATALSEAQLKRLDAQVAMITNALRPLAAMAALVQKQFDLVRGSTATLAAANAPAAASLAGTAAALMGLNGDQAQVGLTRTAGMLASITTQAGAAEDAIAGLNQGIEGTEADESGSQTQSKGEAETHEAPEHKRSGVGSAVATAVGAQAGTSNETEQLSKIAAEEKKVEAETRHVADAVDHLSQAMNHNSGEAKHNADETHKAGDATKKAGDQIEKAGHQSEHTKKEIEDLRGGFRGLGEAFARIGLSIADLRKMDAGQQFGAIMLGLQKLPDQASRSSVAMKIFGRSAMEVQAILNADPADFAESMKDAAEYAQVMGQSAAAFEDIERKFFVFKEQIETIFARIAAGMVPAVQSLLNLVNKIDFSKWGKDISMVMATVTQAFSQGKVGEIIELAMTISFKNAVNTYYRLFASATAAIETAWSRLPMILKDGLGFFINPSFWQGSAEIMIGSILTSWKMGLQAIAASWTLQAEWMATGLISAFGTVKTFVVRMFQEAGALASVLFEDAAWAMKDPLTKIFSSLGWVGESIAKELHKIGPSIDAATGKLDTMSDRIADKIKASSVQLASAGIVAAPKIVQTISQATSVLGNPEKLVTGGAAKVETAMSGQAKVPADIVGTFRAEFTAALERFEKGGDLLSTKEDLAKLAATIADLQKAIKSPEDAPAPKASSPQASLPNLSYKQPEGDRLAKMGLFVGGSTATPGLTEARRTAAATERMAKGIDRIVNVSGGRPGQTAAIYN